MKYPLIPQEDKKILCQISDFALDNKAELYLVGGYLRDMLAGRRKENPDIDFCLKKNAIAFSRRLCHKIGGGFVVLDKEHGCSRIVKKAGGKVYTIDFSDFRGKTLEDDLSLRDFTINSFAIRLKDFICKANPAALFIDPLSGAKDLRAGLLKVDNDSSFDDDPLRLLRAFSFSAIFGFKIEKHTLRLITKNYKKLSLVSYERIRDEVFKVLDCKSSADYFKKIDDLGILSLIMPEIDVMRGVRQGPYHHLDVFKHSMQTLRELELLFSQLKRNKELNACLNERICGDRKRSSLIKLGAFLHDIGKPKARRREGRKIKFHGHELIGRGIASNIARRLKLSGDELDCLRIMIFWHLRPGYLADNQVITARAKFRFFRDTKKEVVSVLLLSIADQRSTRGPLTSEEERIHHEKVCLSLIKEYFRKAKENKPIKFINGDDLIRKFKLVPSPLIGRILAEIEELQAVGKVKNKKAAFAFAAKIIRQTKLPHG